jgi:hypothetical protein
MDRIRANQNIAAGLRLAALAIFIFALTFWVAIVYIN